MPPRKRGRFASGRASTPSTDTGEKEVADSRPTSRDGKAKKAQSSRQWTEEQETVLLRSIIRWKPVGMHKHFRMLEILDALHKSGSVTSTDKPFTSQQVWTKLSELYDLEALDEREDGFGFSVQNDATDEPFLDFVLPDSDYSDMQFDRRLAPKRTSSPPLLGYQLAKGHGKAAVGQPRRYSTVEDSEDPRSSPPSVKGSRRGRASRGGRGSHLAETSRPGRSTRGRISSVDASVEDDDKGQEANEDSMEVDDDDGGKSGRADSRVDAERSGTRRSGRRK